MHEVTKDLSTIYPYIDIVTGGHFRATFRREKWRNTNSTPPPHPPCLGVWNAIPVVIFSHKKASIDINLLKKADQTCRNMLVNSSSLEAFLIPFPPPPSDALIITGYPIFAADWVKIKTKINAKEIFEFIAIQAKDWL